MKCILYSAHLMVGINFKCILFFAKRNTGRQQCCCTVDVFLLKQMTEYSRYSTKLTHSPMSLLLSFRAENRNSKIFVLKNIWNIVRSLFEFWLKPRSVLRVFQIQPYYEKKINWKVFRSHLFLSNKINTFSLLQYCGPFWHPYCIYIGYPINFCWCQFILLLSRQTFRQIYKRREQKRK